MLMNKDDIILFLKFLINNTDSKKTNKAILTSSSYRNTNEIVENLICDINNNGYKLIKGVDEIRILKDNFSILGLPLGDGSKIRGHRANLIIADDRQIDFDIYNSVIKGNFAIKESPITKKFKGIQFYAYSYE